MRNRRVTAVPMILIAAAAVVVGLAVPAAGREAGHLINGAMIKKHSLAGNRLKANTLTGADIKESTLGTVPTSRTAESLPALTWHALTLENGWKNYGDGVERSAEYAVDAQGILHFRGAIDDGVSKTVAFALPAHLLPANLEVDLPIVCGTSGNACFLGLEGGAASPTDSGTSGSGAVETFTSLEGITVDTR